MKVGSFKAKAILQPQKEAVAVPVASLAKAKDVPIVGDIFLFDRRDPDSAISVTSKILEARTLGQEIGLPKELSEASPKEAIAFGKAAADDLPTEDKTALQGWLKKQSELMLLSELPNRMSDGVVRTKTLTASPLALETKAVSEGWERDQKTGLPLVDAVVVGGGPGGLSSAFQLREHGKTMALFEAGSIGQSFSDAGAAGTHFMRTSGATNDLATYRDIPKSWDHPLGLFSNRELRLNALQSDAECAKLTGLEQLDSNEYQDLKSGERRSVFFQHMNHIAADVAQSEGCFVSELCRVKAPKRRDDGLWEVESGNGHRLVARNVILATGQVGSGGSSARMPEQMKRLASENPGQYLLLRKDQDIWEQAEAFEEHLVSLKGKDHNKTSLVVTDRLLGQQPVQLALARMEPGKRVAVIGGGESAAKAVLEIVRQNPELKVDLYSDRTLLPSQLQVPDSEVSFDVWREPEYEGTYGQESLERFKKFGTPISLHALKDLLELEAQGKVRIREMGERFQESSVKLRGNSDGSTSVELISQAARDALYSSRGELETSGIYPEGTHLDSPDVLPDADMFVVATGYDKKMTHSNPLFQSLQEQDVLEVDERGNPVLNERGMASAKEPSLYFVTAGAVAKSSDTTIPGNRGRALKVVEEISGLAGDLKDVEYAHVSTIGYTEEQAKAWEKRILKELKDREPEDREHRRIWRNEQMLFPATRSLPTIHLNDRVAKGDVDQVDKLVFTRALELEAHMKEEHGVEQVTREELAAYLASSGSDSPAS